MSAVRVLILALMAWSTEGETTRMISNVGRTLIPRLFNTVQYTECLVGLIASILLDRGVPQPSWVTFQPQFEVVPTEGVAYLTQTVLTSQSAGFVPQPYQL
ncbi:hypothetical protein BD414DRAFT_481945 [Trametes punicea]|nr:hypothetical protein BD414DRAFT_481945 [Trametes punicea]